MRLKERSRFHNIKLQGEAASADIEAGASYPRDPARVTDARGYTKQQIFIVDIEPSIGGRGCAGLSWLERRSQWLWLQNSKHRLTLLLRTNAAGGLKLKLVIIYHSENARAL